MSSFLILRPLEQLAGTLDIAKKPFKTKYFVSLNFAITKICVAIRFVEDEAKMGGI